MYCVKSVMCHFQCGTWGLYQHRVHPWSLILFRKISIWWKMIKKCIVKDLPEPITGKRLVEILSMFVVENITTHYCSHQSVSASSFETWLLWDNYLLQATESFRTRLLQSKFRTSKYLSTPNKKFNQQYFHNKVKTLKTNE